MTREMLAFVAEEISRLRVFARPEDGQRLAERGLEGERRFRSVRRDPTKCLGRFVKALAPVHNRRLRRSVELCAWHWRAQAPADPPRLVSARDLDPEDFADLHGLFRSRSAAREELRALSVEHGLCPILLGLERGRGPCFAHQIRRCRGACVGKESRLAHGLRLGEALTRLKMRPWPFAGRVGIREPGGTGDSLIVLDRWCYLGTACSDAALQELLEERPRPVFDLDTYRILTRYLLGPARPRCTVVPLPA